MPTNQNPTIPADGTATVSPASNAQSTISEVKSNAAVGAPSGQGPDVAGLETAIRSGNFSAEQAGQYNSLKGDNEAARKLMLSSQEAMANPNVSTTLTEQEKQAFPKAASAMETKPAQGFVPPQGQPTQGQTQQGQPVSGQPQAGKPTSGTTTPPAGQKPATGQKQGFLTEVEREKQLGNIPVLSNIAVKTQEERDKIDFENAKSTSGQQILRNIELMRSQDPTFASDRKRFEEMTGYDKKDEGEKRLVDAVWQKYNKPKDVNGYFNELVRGGDVYNKTLRNSPDYQEASTLFAKYNKFRQMDASSLYASLLSNEIDPRVSDALGSNPEFVQAKKRFNQAKSTDATNTVSQAFLSKDTGTDGPRFNDVSKLEADAIAVGGGSKTFAELYLRFGNTEEMKDLAKQQAEIDGKRNKIAEDIEGFYLDMKEKHPNATAQELMLISNASLPRLQRELRGLNIEASTIASRLKTATESAKAQYDAFSKDLESEKSVEAEERAFKRNIALEDYRVRLNREQLEWERTFNEGDINSSDKKLRDRAIKNTVSDEIKRWTELGAIFERSPSEIEKAIQNRMNNGETSANAIWNEIGANAVKKPEVIAKRRLLTQSMSDVEKMNVDISEREKDRQLQRDLANMKATQQASDDAIAKSKAEAEAKLKAMKEASDKAEKDFEDANTYDVLEASSLYNTIADNINASKSGTQALSAFSGEGWVVDGIELIPNGNGKKRVSLIDGIGNKIVYEGIDGLNDSVNIGSKLRFGELVGFSTEGDITTGIFEKSGKKFNDSDAGYYLKSVSSIAPMIFKDMPEGQIISLNNSSYVKSQKQKVAQLALRNFEGRLYDSGDLYGAMRLSKGKDKHVTGAQLDSLIKLASLADIYNTKESQFLSLEGKTGPFVNLFTGNKYVGNPDVIALSGELTGLIPLTIKGLFGEVGALTNTDIKLYSSALPEISKKHGTNIAIASMIQRQILKRQAQNISSLARDGYDVSGFRDDYLRATKKLVELGYPEYDFITE